MSISFVNRRFMNWRDVVLTPLVEIVVLSSALGVTVFLQKRFDLSLFVIFIAFALANFVASLAFLFFLRTVHPIRTGIYSVATDPWTFYVWRLHGFICSINLFPFYSVSLVPSILRPFFYRLLGARVPLFGTSLHGRILDPYLVSLGDSTVLGDDAILVPFSYNVGTQDLLVLGRIEIGEGAHVGLKSTVMPGTVVGKNAMLKPMSFVPMNSKIPTGEIWGGNPVQKIADIDHSIGFDSAEAA